MDIKKFFLVSFIAFLVDQAAKLFLKYVLGFGTQITIIPKVLSIKMTRNTGAAFSIMSSMNTVIIFITIFILGIILFYYDKIDKENKIYFAVIFGSALGNLFDRIVYGYVIDFISLSFWPVFNLADAMITISTAVLVYNLIKKK